MVTLTLDRERRVAFTWGAIKRLQREQGINFLQMVGEDEQWFMDPTKFSAVLWCGLIEDDPTLTVGVVDTLITLPRLGVIAEAMLKAVGEALQEGEQSENPPTPSPA